MTASATERAADYHNDTAELLTSTFAKDLVQTTPAHAKARRENPTTSDAQAFGIAVHQLLLRDDRVDVIPFDEWRTNEAKELVARSRAAGRVPMKPKYWEAANRVAQAVRDHLALCDTIEPLPFTEGTAEHTIRFESNGAQCRSMLDWLRNDHLFIDDLKTTGKTAEPHAFSRELFKVGFDIQAAFYCRAVEAEYGVTPGFRWVVVETKPPYPVSIVTLSAEAMDAARAKVDSAILIWNECLAKNEWPAYSRDIHTADLPPWQKDLWAEVDPGEEVPF